MSTVFILVILLVLLLVTVLFALFIIKCVSMYRQSEKDKKYDAMLQQPLEKFGDTNAEELAQKYNDKQ